MNRIMKIKILSIVIATLIITSCGNSKQENHNNNKDTVAKEIVVKKEKSIYDKAGIIKVKDPMASLVGYKKAGEDYFEISLDDVGKYSGHVCAGIASGFLVVKQALEILYPNGEVPVRGQIRVAAQGGGDQLDVASYITGARAFYGRQEVNANDLIIDKSLAGDKGTFTMIFYRKDNGKMVKTVFNKKKLMLSEVDSYSGATILTLKSKLDEGTATDQEKEEFAKIVHSAVKKVLTDIPDGLITISECTDYIFPKN